MKYIKIKLICVTFFHNTLSEKKIQAYLTVNINMDQIAINRKSILLIKTENKFTIKIKVFLKQPFETKSMSLI